MIKKIKLILKTKIFFRKPKKKEILIFDQTGYEILKNALDLNSAQVSFCSTRLEDFNLSVFMRVILNRRLSYKSYLKQYIKLVNPKIVLTFIDNNLFFYQLKKDFPHIKFISIQNGYRFLNDEMLTTLYNNKIKKTHYLSDFYFVFNKQMKKLIERYIDTNCVVAGSLRNNKFLIKKSNDNFNGNIGFISRFTLAISKSLYEKNEKNPDYLVHKFSSKLLCNTAEYCKRYDKKLFILTTRASLLEQEKKYYEKILQNYQYEYLIKENELDSYHNLLKVDILISPSSTLGSEALGRGLKVLSFSEDKILGSNFGWPFIQNLQGPFFSNNYEYANLYKMLNYIEKLSFEKWKELLDNYSDYTCFFDYDNEIIKKLIEKILNNKK